MLQAQDLLDNSEKIDDRQETVSVERDDDGESMISRYVLDQETGENIKIYVQKDKASKEEIDAHEKRKGNAVLESPKASIDQL